MATLVCFHAHPDDEAIATGGLMAKAAAAGHRVVLVCATRGEQGEPQEGVLAEGEELWQRREVELAEACRILGAEGPLFLGYRDSGMMDEPTNDDPTCFWQADPAQATERLAAILREVEADVVTIYDDHGGYGHPDHIQVHRIGLAAAREVGVAHVYESTMNRTRIRMMMESQQEADAAAERIPDDDEPDRPLTEEELEHFGTAADDISFVVDVSGVIDAKRAAMVAHRSQIGPDSFFLAADPERFVLMFGEEAFNVPGVTGTGGPEPVDLLPGL